MSFSSWFRSSPRRTAVRQLRFQPSLEALEDRLAPATFMVTNTNNSGAGSLRQAILSADAMPGPNSITFHIDSGGLQYIKPTSPLPAITESVAIKGATQPGFSGAPLIILDGLSAPSTSQGLVLTGSNCSVDALSIIFFGQYGIDIQGGTGNVVSRCDIGISPVGVGDANGAGGVLLGHGAHGNRIGGAGAGNVISGNEGDGIDLIGPGTNGNAISSNFIGTGLSGNSALGNSVAGVGVLAGASGNTITGNTLSGNGSFGVMILDPGTQGNRVAGNRIGLGASGSALANGFAGTDIAQGASGNIIGGATSAARNVISGNGFDGVLISGDGTAGNIVESDFIGVGIDGASNEANGINGIAVQDGAGGNSLAGNVIGFQSAAGVLIDSGGSNSIRSNFVGISASGVNIGNGNAGIQIQDGSKKNLIAANDIGNNGFPGAGGIQLEGAGTTGNSIQSNTIGLTTGGAAAPNSDGVLIESGASNNTVGGASKALRNVISANFSADVGILTGSSGNVVQSNFIGTNDAGTGAAPNQGGLDVDISGSHNQIGGIGLGNVISGNSGATGILISGSTATGNVVQGNFIGTNAAGTAAVSNLFGVILSGANNQIGGTAPGAGNIIAANTGDGVGILGTGTSGNVLQGNRIGIGSGGQALGNGVGVFMFDGASDNLIGGTALHAGNIIANSTQQGVVIGASTSDTTTVGNAVLGNSIFANGGIGIDLANDGVTANQPAGTAGPNDFQNFPVLNLARRVAGDVIVQGTLNSTPNTTFRIELFASAAADSSGHGQGQFLLGYVTVTTNSSGNASFAAALPFTGAPGKVISATATALSSGNAAANAAFGDTSEFSADLTAF